jgi:hypothetical protein
MADGRFSALRAAAPLQDIRTSGKRRAATISAMRGSVLIFHCHPDQGSAFESSIPARKVV